MNAPVVRLLMICLLAGWPASLLTADTRPQRIASLGLCTDQILLMLADREQIATVTHDATNPKLSYMAAKVGDIPLNHGTAEEIIPFRPDLVISTAFASPDATRMLQLLGYRVELLPLPTSVEGIRDMLRQAAHWLGAESKAESLIRRMDATIAEAQLRNQHKPTRRAMIYSPNGYTIGRGTTEDDVLRLAGYRNLASEMGIHQFQQISLETLVSSRPERILIDNAAYNQDSLAYSYVNHPVIRHLIPEEARMYVPSQLRDCAGPQVAEEIAWLADHR